ncbi:HAMP domain-containing sensor histidine kinase [Methylosinus sp. R-45379]|uniref:sensor histidine kinase n=1 Tax=Methylosinus sp. R-45379 TaxID=980563 RepID=UPI0007C927B0|nr:HAMP domain-containing sensor histidine kinase [Methylosinus sp. R-45379]
MRAKSLRLRLSIAASLSLCIALVLAGVALVALFERYVIRRVGVELDTYIRQLAANVSIEPDGALQLGRPLADPRFDQPLSGLYWQNVEDGAGVKLRSRSLWDHVIDLPNDEIEPGIAHHHDLAGPKGETLFLGERRVNYATEGGRRRLRITAAVDRNEILEARTEFAGDMAVSLAVLALILLASSWGQIAVGLRPLEALRRNVNAVRVGEKKSITVDGPEEIMPLVAEVNSLLEAKAKAVESAKARAANLAHALKTPLAILATDAERLRKDGRDEIADELQELAFGMRRHINRELSRARLQSLAGSPVQSTPLRNVVESLTRAFMRTPRGGALSWRLDIPADVTIGMGVEEATELFGALLENAVKWAATEVHVSAEREGVLSILVEDDGLGIPPEKLVELGQRGVRLDQKTEGAGLGLSISSDIVDAYGGQIRFGTRSPHGFQAIITLPA